MKVYKISAITLRIKEMERSCRFYSQIPGFRLVYGGSTNANFSTYEIGKSNSPKIYLNLELIPQTNDQNDYTTTSRKHFGRIIFHTDDVDKLYYYFKNNKAISTNIIFETVPDNAPWGERYFHIREPDGYQLSFAKPLRKSFQQ
ncbi:MAG: VOC family protein [Nitrososphaeraceae archaeon]|jgi:catechol 2,3-dioxygenase-like lactoylglutathione lyase family enzyme